MIREGRASAVLWESFLDRARSWSGRPAVSMGPTSLTFGDLFLRAERLALAFSKEGLGEGRAAALVLPNSLAFVPVFLALLKLSIPVALVSPTNRSSGLKAIEEGIHPQGYITTAALADVLRQTIDIGRTVMVSVAELGEDLALVFPRSSDPSASASSSALMKFTSGSTGQPKGIPWTADNVLAEAQNVVSTLNITAEDAILAAVPVFHSYGFDLGVLPMLFSGSTLILRDMFIPRRILADLSAPRVKIFLGVPSMYRVWIDALNSSPPDLSHIRYLLSCTAPLHPDLIVQFHEKYGLPICQHYGSSETGAATTHVPSEVLARPESVGLPMDNVEIQILDNGGAELPRGTEGEVIIRSRAVARGYVMGQPLGKTVFRDGAYWTGDIGVLDDRGFLFLRGRKDDMINVGGLKVFPEEVTRVIERFPAVKEAAVVGVKDARGEEVVYAVVTLKGPATENEILLFCRRYLADYKIPRRIDIRLELPVGPTGKIQLRAEDIHL